MPFTLSHPAAVLPLRRTGLPMAAVVCGSMAPDLHMVVPGITDAQTHRWSGLPTYDLALGMALTAVWVLVLAPVFTLAAPLWVRERLRPGPAYDARRWLLAVPGVLIGVATHLGWDTFTHATMWGGRHVPWLYEVHHGYPGYELAQYGSSVAGLVVIGAWMALTLRSRSPRPVADEPRATSAAWVFAAPIALATLSAVAIFVALSVRFASTDLALAAALRAGLVGATVGVVASATVWRFADWALARRPSRS